MSWMPIFTIGFWNAWILTLFMILHPFIMKLVDKAVGSGDINQKMGASPDEQGEKKSFPIPTMLMIALFILSIFIPLMLGRICLYIGLAIYLVGILMFLSAILTAARTPLGRIFSQGMYRYSRHPLYLSFLIVFLGISIATASWFFLLLSMGWMIFPISQVSSEEQGCIDSFGDEYKKYMKRTPKWLGIPKSY
jgi:protein-S-isoprenylcysteine O-methyltransferase Ste14